MFYLFFLLFLIPLHSWNYAQVRTRKLIDLFEKTMKHSSNIYDGAHHRSNSLSGPDNARRHTANDVNGPESSNEITSPEGQTHELRSRLHIATIDRERVRQLTELVRNSPPQNNHAMAASVAARRRASSVEVSYHSDGSDAAVSTVPNLLSRKASSAPTLIPVHRQLLHLPSSPQFVLSPRAGRANGVADEGSSPSHRVRSEVTADEIGRRKSNTAPAAASWTESLNKIEPQESPHEVTEVSLPVDLLVSSAENLSSEKPELRSSPPIATSSRLQLRRRLSVLTSSQDEMSNDLAPATFSPMSSDNAFEFFQLDDNSMEDELSAAGSRSSTVSSHSSRMLINSALNGRASSTESTYRKPNESSGSGSVSPPLSPLTPMSPLLRSCSNDVGPRRRQSIVGQQLLQRALSGGSVEESLENSPRSSPGKSSSGVFNSVRYANTSARRLSVDNIAASLGDGDNSTRRRSASTGSASSSFGSDSSAALAGKLLLKAQISSHNTPGVGGALSTSMAKFGPLRANDDHDTQEAATSRVERGSFDAVPFVKRKQATAPLMASLFGTFGDNSDDEPSTAFILGESHEREGHSNLGQPVHSDDNATASAQVSPLLSEIDLPQASADALPLVSMGGSKLSILNVPSVSGEDENVSQRPLTRQTSPPSPVKTPRAGRLIPAPEPSEPLPAFSLNNHDNNNDEDHDGVNNVGARDQSDIRSPVGFLRASAVSPVSAPALRTYVFPGTPNNEKLGSDSGPQDTRDGSGGVRMLGAARLFPKATSTSFKEQSMAYDGASFAAPTSDTSTSFDTGAGVGGAGTTSSSSVASWLEGRTVPGQGALDPASVLVLEVLRVSSCSEISYMCY